MMIMIYSFLQPNLYPQGLLGSPFQLVFGCNARYNTRISRRYGEFNTF